MAGISAFASSYRFENLISPLATFLLQQVESAQVSHVATGHGIDLRADHVNKLIRALHDRSKHGAERVVPPSESRRFTQLGLLFDLAARVPPLLQAFDSTNKLDYALLNSLRILEQDLMAWLTSASGNDRRVTSSRCHAKFSVSEDDFQVSRDSLCILTRESLFRICLLLISECSTELQRREPSAMVLASSAEVHAVQLKSTMHLLACAAKVPICTARAISAPLHFLTQYYVRTKSTAGQEWCAQFKHGILQSAPWLRWDVLLPWSLLTVHEVPLYRT